MKLIDMTGQRFGKLAVERRGDNNRIGQARWICRCDCGGSALVEGRDLRNGHTTSCGCGRIDRMKEILTTHGRSQTGEYKSWCLIKDRCYNQNSPSYVDYGQRGIAVCSRWAESFEAFCEDMGPRPTARHSIDRIDNDGDYEPGNCRWATYKQQARNTRRTRFISVEGEVGKLAELAEAKGIAYGTLAQRARRGSFGVAFVERD